MEVCTIQSREMVCPIESLLWLFFYLDIRRQVLNGKQRLYLHQGMLIVKLWTVIDLWPRFWCINSRSSVLFPQCLLHCKQIIFLMNILPCFFCKNYQTFFKHLHFPEKQNCIKTYFHTIFQICQYHLPSCCSKLVWFSFFCRPQKEMLTTCWCCQVLKMTKSTIKVHSTIFKVFWIYRMWSHQSVMRHKNNDIWHYWCQT